MIGSRLISFNSFFRIQLLFDLMVKLHVLTSKGAIFSPRRCRWWAREAVQVSEVYMVGSSYNICVVIVIKCEFSVTRCER